MSVKRNVGISLFSQAFFVGTRLIVVPIYLHLMGVEAYGLVGLFVLFTALIQLLNLGISSTTSREISRMRGGATNSATVHGQLRRSLLILGSVSLIFAGSIALLAPLIAAHWLHVVSIAPDAVVASLRLMGVAAALTFVSNLFKGGLLGMERQGRLNLMNSVFAALRSLGVIMVLVFVAPTPVIFCTYQLAISVIEVVVFRIALYQVVPPAHGEVDSVVGKNPKLRRFAAGIAFTEIVWLAVLQTDRTVLSTALTLSKFGYFTVMTTAAYGLLLLASPITQSLQPRFTVLAAEYRNAELRALYMRITYGLTALVFSAAGIMIFFPKTLILAWTSNEAISNWSIAVLPLYAAGNAIVCVLSLPFLLQFALGEIRSHVWGHVATAVVYIPAASWAGLHYGAQGTGVTWFAVNLLYLLIVVPVIHARVLPGGHREWFYTIVCPAIIMPLVILFALSWLPLPAERALLIVMLCGYGSVALAATVLARQEYRSLSWTMLRSGLRLLHIFISPPSAAD